MEDNTQSTLEPKVGSGNNKGNDQAGCKDQRPGNGEKQKQGFKPFKPKDHGKGDKDKRDKKKYDNDVQWYKQSPVLALQAGSVSTAHINGFNYGLNTYGINNTEKSGENDCGVRMAKIAITPSHSFEIGDPYNQAMVNLFNFIRGKYTSSVPFQANDLGCYFRAVGNVIAAISEVKRTLDAVSAWSKQTKDLATLEFKASGYTSLLQIERQNVAANQLSLNILQTRLECLALPRSMSFFKRCAWITRFFYFDDAVGYEGNIYGYRLDHLYKFSAEVPTHDQPSLKATGLVKVSLNKKSIAAVLKTISDCIDALVNDDNARQISGWLMQYYKDFIFTTEYLKIGDSASAAFSAEIKNQFANIKTSNLSVIRPDTIPQDISKQCLYNPTATTAPADYKYPEVFDGWIMRTHALVPNVDEVLVGTRLTAASLQIEAGSVQLYTDLFVAYEIHYYTYAGDYEVPQVIDADVTTSIEILTRAKFVSACPTLAIANLSKDDPQDIRIQKVTGFTYSKEKTYSVSGSDLIKMHRVCILSQFGIPAATADPLASQR